MKKWVIDTNIFAHWLMANHMLGFLISHFNLSQEFLKVYQSHTNESNIFINAVLNKTGDKDNIFFMTELSLNEIFSALRDEIRTIILFVNGVPISKWASKRESKEATLSESLSKHIYNLTLKGLDVLISGKRIEIIKTTLSSDEPDYLEVYSSLVFFNPYLKTQDAMLISTAIFEKAKYFITTDKDVLKRSKQMGSNYGLRILNPKDALHFYNK